MLSRPPSRAAALLGWLERRPFHSGMAALAAGLAAAERPRPVAVAALGAAALLAVLRRPRLAVAVGCALLLGATIGAARLDSLDARMHAARPATSLAATATLLERPRPSAFESSAAIR